MVQQHEIYLIIMLCKLEENNKTKCSNYWDNANIHDFTLKYENEEFEILDGIILRNVGFYTKGNELFPTTFIQLHYTCWEDHSAPNKDSYKKIIELIKLIEVYKNNRPVIVHCSAGVGRSGTFISLYNLYHIIMNQINDVNTKEIKFSIMDIVRQLKEMRLRLVENEKQYLYLYQFVNILLDENN